MFKDAICKKTRIFDFIHFIFDVNRFLLPKCEQFVKKLNNETFSESDFLGCL